MITVLPSSGGKGSRLKAQSSRFRTNKILSAVVRNVGSGECVDATSPAYPLILAGGRKYPAATPTRMAMPARSISVKLAAGPAKAIQPERRGYLRCQLGSNGALAKPIIQPDRANDKMGITTMPY